MTKIGVVNGMGDNMFMPKASTAGEKRFDIFDGDARAGAGYVAESDRKRL